MWIYNGTSWDEQDEVIDGNLIVAGTVTADRLEIGTVGQTNSRMLLLEDSLKIFEGTTLRVHLGNLSNTTT